jgi:2-polyprenyl-3-methyl-5-hydroxy-6-metoxy-1,4-benzoquinol methylase
MASLHTTERQTYSDIWSQVPHYADHAPGEHYVPLFVECVEQFGRPRLFGNSPSVLDAGTGSGKGALALQKAGFRVTLCDVTNAGLVPDAKRLPYKDACLWQSLESIAPRGAFDYVYCTDVLEHVPTELTMLVIHQLLRVARRALFLSVSLVEDNFGNHVGRPLHLTVKPYRWWRDAIREVGTVLDARDLQTDATFYVRAR